MFLDLLPKLNVSRVRSPESMYFPRNDSLVCSTGVIPCVCRFYVGLVVKISSQPEFGTFEHCRIKKSGFLRRFDLDSFVCQVTYIDPVEFLFRSIPDKDYDLSTKVCQICSICSMNTFA